jgi:AmmeMemoRadiSam system protein B
VVIPGTVVLLAPNHTGMGSRFGVWARGAWETPLGSVPVDEDMATELLDTVPGLSADNKSHLREHSLEVHLPILQYLRPGTKIVPISVSISDADDIGSAAVALGRVVAARASLIAASTDMTHFSSAQRASEQDAPAIAAIGKLDWRELLAYVLGNRVSMCGVRPVALMLASVARMGAKRADLVGYTHSGVVTGETNEVVAYAGFVVPREK